MKILKNVSLLPLNTFHINATALNFCEFSHIEELREALNWLKSKDAKDLLVLGGGSNILLTRNVDYVLANRIGGFEIAAVDGEYVFVKAGAGMNWHSFVLKCIEKGLGGVENLSLIPGNVGASPMQNIGAYGVEIKDVFHRLEAMEITSGALTTMGPEECAFGYRESVFKNKYRNRFIITSVTFRLSRKPVINTSYGAIEEELKKMNVEHPGIEEVSKAVINIRRSKLPDPAVTGNAGSFFKNPEIETSLYEQLKLAFPAIPGFKINEQVMKVPAAWLIEQCGWKGFREGDAGCHERQPLVLVNLGQAGGEEILNLSSRIMESVKKRFGISLYREVNIV